MAATGRGKYAFDMRESGQKNPINHHTSHAFHTQIPAAQAQQAPIMLSLVAQRDCGYMCNALLLYIVCCCWLAIASATNLTAKTSSKHDFVVFIFRITKNAKQTGIYWSRKQ
jgi:hypothetical protein